MADLPLDDDGSVIPGLINHLSSSSIGEFLKCPRRFWFRYIAKWPTVIDGGLITGRGVHNAIDYALQHQIAPNGSVVPLDEVKDVAGDAFEVEADNEDFNKDHRPEFKDKAVRLAGLWREQVQPLLRPVAIEVPWECRFNDVKVIGRIDLVEEHQIRDWKTSGKKPQEDAAFSKPQTELYVRAEEKALGELRPITYTYLVDQPRAGLRTFDVTVDRPNELKSLGGFADETVRDVAAAVRAGNFPRNRDQWSCSEKWCPWFGPCIKQTNGPRP